MNKKVMILAATAAFAGVVATGCGSSKNDRISRSAKSQLDSDKRQYQKGFNEETKK
ncbi:hypothetical protein AGMMS49965_00010 [Bacteroidia bacterium]|nr:hypothetical protein AGMMS49965_00010 [Bacteroidia bacterium]